MHDARWALDVVRREQPGLPIALVGHSMGGRVALRLAGDDGVTALVGLAPWVHASDEPHGGPGLSALLLHGSLDRTTDPRATEQMAAQLRARGADATYRPVKVRARDAPTGAAMAPGDRGLRQGRSARPSPNQLAIPPAASSPAQMSIEAR